MKIPKYLKSLTVFSFLAAALIALPGCEKSATEPGTMTDDEYIQSVISSGYDNDYSNEDNLMKQEYEDLNEGGPFSDSEGGMNNFPIDSLYKWGRRITGVSRNFNVTSEGDSIKKVAVTTTLSGNYIILGYHNGALDTVVKPYTEVLKRNVWFKRVNNTPYPVRNWRLYRISGLDGETSQPQTGSSLVQITKLEIYLNNAATPQYTFYEPDFSTIYFKTKMFGGSGIPQIDRNEQVKVKIFTTSQLAPVDYVAFHWAKNSFGFHRIPFSLESETGSGPYYRVFTKTFNIYGNHRLGVFNAYFSASTRESLYDNDISKFASDMVGIPFKVIK
ncbi:MAG: hypothetical protein AB2L26_03445 [Ignavibacteria bacterium]